MNPLILQLAALQVGLPLVLIVLNALLPAASRTALLLRAGAVLLLIVYVALAGMWLFPPWWTPYVLALLHLFGTGFAWVRLRWGTGTPIWRRWGEPGLAVLAVFGFVALLMPVLAGRTAPAGAIDLAMPLGPGTYYVVSGGSTQAVNVHLGTLTGERFRPYRGQSFAADIIGIDVFGLHADGIAPRDPAAYVIHGTEVLAPCTGDVVLAQDGLPDQQVPEADRDNLAGNFVLIACGDHIVALAHLMLGSVAVDAGVHVNTGDVIGRVGNSGNTTEPHLHIHVQSGAPEHAPLSGEPVWFTLGGHFPARGDILHVQ